MFFFFNDSNETNESILFEQFVTTILLRIASKNEQKITLNGQNGIKKTDYKFHFDAYAPNGIDDLEGNIIIEIKKNAPVAEIQNLYKRFKQNYLENFKLLVITDSKNKKVLEYNDLFVWGHEKIAYLRNKYTVDAFNYFENVFDLTEDDFISYNESNKNLLKNIISNNEKYLTLVLGSGVSLDFGLPTWDDLINEFLSKITIKKGVTNFDYIFSKIGSSNLIKSQFIIENFSTKIHVSDKEKDFCIELQNFLYKHKAFSSKINSSLHSIAKLIERNNRTNKSKIEVITYNYDDLLENYFDSLSINNYQTIFKDETLKKDNIPIFHVHGFLPRIGMITNEISESIIFSEYKYHKLFNNPYLWQLSCQLTRFRETVCLFIGFSLIDPSVRRLLETIISSNPNIQHFAIFARENKMLADIIDFATVSRHFADLELK